MKTKCYNCIYFNELEDDCIKDQYDGCDLLGDKCTIFKARKECKNRWEDCSGMCDIICHQFPSDAGCKFIYRCELDNYPCDEKCEKHEKRHKLNDLTEKLGKLYDSKRLMEILIEEYKAEINTLKEETNK